MARSVTAIVSDVSAQESAIMGLVSAARVQKNTAPFIYPVYTVRLLMCRHNWSLEAL
jgi:hypothetical protein